MKKLPVLLALLMFDAWMVAPGVAQEDFNVDALLSRMTLDEKAGQMMQVTLEILTESERSPLRLDENKLREALVRYKIGSILNTGVKHALSLEQWRYVNKTIQDMALGETARKIPVLYGVDSIHGATYVLDSTLFPHNLAMAATRNPDLMRRSAEIAAAETRAAGLRWTFAPVLDLGRHPLWARLEETFGEDPCLESTFGVASVHGFQGSGFSRPPGVAACAKHYVGYSFPFTGKDRAPAFIPEHTLREYFLPPFREAIKAGVRTVMVNSSEINGIPVHANKYLLTDVLRGELGFDGVILSDWEDVKHLHDWYRVADSQKEAARLAVDAGIDMSMVPADYSFADFLKQLVREGRVSEKRIDDSVRRILRLKADVGLFKNPYVEPEAAAGFGKPEYRQVALQAAEEAITLLKNDNATLPLSKSRKVLVAGPAAKSLAALHGSWSYTWQGDDERWFPKQTLTIVDAIREMIGETNVLYRQGVDFNGKAIDVAATVDVAAGVDSVVLCLGENAYCEAVGDIPDLTLARGQLELAQRLFATGKPVVLVLAQGRGRIIREIEPGAKAIVMAYRPGSEGARALAKVIFGETNPSGKLPFTYQRYPNNLITYDRTYLDRRAVEQPPVGFNGIDFTPQWEFGFGLSYTSYEYKHLKLDARVLKPGGRLAVSVDVTNTGRRAGKECVELYTRDLYASIDPPSRRLRAFRKFELQTGETRTATFELTAADLAFVNARNERVTEPGEFEVIVGKLRARFRYVE